MTNCLIEQCTFLKKTERPFYARHLTLATIGCGCWGEAHILFIPEYGATSQFTGHLRIIHWVPGGHRTKIAINEA
jgi:hypothetical protein